MRLRTFYKYQSPYAHGIAAEKYQAEDPLNFFYDTYSTRASRAYRKTCSHPFPPISIEDLVVDHNIKPPILRKQAGRPRTKRIRKEAWERMQTRCRTALIWDQCSQQFARQFGLRLFQQFVLGSGGNFGGKTASFTVLGSSFWQLAHSWQCVSAFSELLTTLFGT